MKGPGDCMTRSQPDPAQLPPSAGKVTRRIVRVDAETRLEAIERLVGGSGRSGRVHAERFVEFSDTHAIRIDAMWASLDEAGRIAATVLAVPNPGRTAMIFASPPASREELGRQAELIDHACRELGAMDLHLAQVLTEPQDTLQREAFLAGRFVELAHLSYLERPLAAAGKAAPARWPKDVTVEPYHQALRREMITVLERSYEETLDCPDLRGLRRTEDILDGHQGTGEFDADLWTLLRIRGEASGVLLLNRAPANNTIELVYIGLAKTARGRGLARPLLRHGLNLLTGRPERAITLAVDERNEPAIALYRGEGFRRVLRRIALIRPLQAAARPT